MAAGTVTALNGLNREDIVASATVGTTVFFSDNKGNLKSYTIAGGAVSAALVRLNEIITGIATLNGTTLYLVTDQGNVYSFVVSGATLTKIAGNLGRISSVCMYSTLLYVGIAGNNDGVGFYSVSIS